MAKSKVRAKKKSPEAPAGVARPALEESPHLPGLQKAVSWLPVLCAFLVWASPLAFFPVPWPDDSAFYFVARELFQWPPRWVMLPQAPFEPSYTEWNFNTMPLYPLLLGVGQWVGIAGSHMLKVWPLGFWAASGVWLLRTLFRQGLPLIFGVLLALLWGLEPNLRWASVLVRPESLIGLAGVVLVLGMTFGFPKAWVPRKAWDPTAALLALAAYAHFNAIHLLFPVILGAFLGSGNSLRDGWRTLVRQGALTALYLSPWILTVLWRFDLFLRQMETQWTRLAVPNGWLSSIAQAIRDLFPDMGNPGPWPAITFWMAGPIWVLIFVACGVLGGAVVLRARQRGPQPKGTPPLVPAAGWVLGACWLWESKPEVWFTYYIHAAVWVFAGILLISARRAFARSASRVAERVKLLSKEGEIESFEADAEWRRLSGAHTIRGGIAGLLVLGLVGSLGISAYVAAEQAFTPPQKTSWSWSVYRSLVDCVDQDLMALEKRLGSPKDFRVWGPTFPDILIELSLRHPHWQFTRTNDFHARRPQAVEHGVKDVHAMVTTETLQPEESWLTGLQSEFPLIRSVWMTWDAYYLSEFLKIPDWMPHRRYCQRGRWRAFLYLKN